MATNKLMEAAAEILSGSKKSAPAMPPEKLDGEVVDLGGPTNQNYKSTDDSAKIDTTKAAKSATAPATKPSAASSDKQEMLGKGKTTLGEDEEEKQEEVIAEAELDLSEDINADRKSTRLNSSH